MFAAGVVEAVDVFEKGCFDLTPGSPVAAADEFGLQRFEEAFDSGIIIAIAFPAHRGCQIVLAQKLLIVVGAVLRPAIGVVNAARRRSAQGGRHVHGPQSEVLLHPVADCPTDHSARKQIKDNSEIDPSFVGPHIGDVSGPLLVWAARREVLARRRLGAMLKT